MITQKTLEEAVENMDFFENKPNPKLLFNKTKRMDKELFNKKLKEGKIMIGGLGNPEGIGIRITLITKNRVWFK